MGAEETIWQQLTQVFRKVFNNLNLKIDAETTAGDVREWTSLTHMTLIAEIEETFNIEFSLSEVTAFRNVGDILAAIKSKTD